MDRQCAFCNIWGETMECLCLDCFWISQEATEYFFFLKFNGLLKRGMVLPRFRNHGYNDEY